MAIHLQIEEILRQKFTFPLLVYIVFYIVKYFEQIHDSNKIFESLKHIFYHLYFILNDTSINFNDFNFENFNF